MDHPLVGTLTRRLIWQFQRGKKKASGIWSGDRFVDQKNKAIDWPDEKTSVRLWHPLGEKQTETITAWRDWLMEHEVRQPFKQAHREVYLLTDAERNTRVYSNRFAAHALKQHQFNALYRFRAGQEPSRRRWIDPIGSDFGDAEIHGPRTSGRKSCTRWRFKPGLADKLVFDRSGQTLFSFRVETRKGDRMPDDSSPPEKFPRVGRIRYLLGENPNRPPIEVDCSNWRVYTSAIDPLARYVVVHGIHKSSGQLQKRITAYRLTDGKQAWTIRCTQDNLDGQLSIDPTGRNILVMLGRGYDERALLDLQSGGRLTDALTSNWWLSENQEFGFGRSNIPRYRYRLVAGRSETPIVAMGLAEFIEGHAAQFSPDSSLIAWCKADGSVTVCEISELKRNLMKIGVGW